MHADGNTAVTLGSLVLLTSLWHGPLHKQNYGNLLIYAHKCHHGMEHNTYYMKLHS